MNVLPDDTNQSWLVTLAHPVAIIFFTWLSRYLLRRQDHRYRMEEMELAEKEKQHPTAVAGETQAGEHHPGEAEQG